MKIESISSPIKEHGNRGMKRGTLDDEPSAKRRTK
jgi:hypothetical protein